MNSDSSNKTKETFILRRCWKDRTFRTIVLALLLIILMGMSRPDKSVGMYPKKYWATKLTWQQCADAVITGDSRTLMGLSPAEMEKELDYDHIMNFGFGANWYEPRYLQTVEDLLDPKSKKKAVMIGITPHSLTHRENDELGHFLNMVDKSKQDIYFEIHLAALLNFLDPMSFRDAYQGLFPQFAPTHTRQEFFADGWISVHKEPTNTKREVKRYRGIYQKRQVSQQTIDFLLEYVSRWNSAGINVYGFMLPTCKEMDKLETEVSGFNQSEFKEVFEQAGGKWIDVDQHRYESFDGSHLQDVGALEFSRALAVSIRDIEQQKNKKVVTE